MHEMSLIEFTFDSIEKRADVLGISQVAEVGLIIGRLAAVPALLETAFDIMKQNRPMFWEAKLSIDFREIRLHCRDCGTQFEDSSYVQAQCPVCHGKNLDMIGGEELFIDYFLPKSDRSE